MCVPRMRRSASAAAPRRVVVADRVRWHKSSQGAETGEPEQPAADEEDDEGDGRRTSPIRK